LRGGTGHFEGLRLQSCIGTGIPALLCEVRLSVHISISPYYLHLSTHLGFVSALLHRHVGILGLACVASTLVIVDGPLIQRASTVIPATLTSPVTLNVTIAPEIPHDFSGFWIENPSYHKDIAGFNQAFNYTMPSSNGTVKNTIMAGVNKAIHARLGKLWYGDEPLPNVLQGCDGVCHATIRAPALAVTACSSREISVNYKETSASNRMLEAVVAPPTELLAFSIGTNLVLGSKETIDLVTGYGRSTDCVGTYKSTACTLESAIGEYDITITDGKAVLDSPGEPTIIAISNNTSPSNVFDADNGGYNSTLAGIVAFHWDRWESFVSLFNVNGSMSGGELNTEAYSQFSIPGDPLCPSFEDPMPAMIASLNKLMVYTGAVAAGMESAAAVEEKLDNGVQVHSEVVGTHVQNLNVYHTDYRWFVGAVILELACLCLIAPLYWGWWRLGRSVSFSPLEIANAFEAPAFANCDSNSSGRDLVRAVGNTEVKYGAVRPKRLAFGGHRFTGSPADGSAFNGVGL
jgi:hypothetical protein